MAHSHWQAERQAPTIFQDAGAVQSFFVVNLTTDEDRHISMIADSPAAPPAVALTGLSIRGRQCRAARLSSVTRPVLIPCA